jgi:alkanesulfonate monooxygenase SsuD/methylene tetrahydromethanopterin reductase-like flavin-dependent oxidoreductase (luciferase family)
LKGNTKIAIALRPAIYKPHDLLEVVRILDKSTSIVQVFVPDIPGGLDSIEVCAAALGASQNLHVGSGVIRILEHDIDVLSRRVKSIGAISSNRFTLGVGTGNPGPDPRNTIDLMLHSLEELRRGFQQKDPSFPDATFPRTYIATLRAGIARRVAGRCDGLLLNFCSPDYARSLIRSYQGHFKNRENQIDFACYMKVFYSSDEKVATRLLLEEFVKYDSMLHYHEMFVRNGISRDITYAKTVLSSSTMSPEIPESLGRVSLANPGRRQLETYVKEFVKSGVTLPCLYPYFAAGEESEFVFKTIKDMSKLGVVLRPYDES